jgi:hypothetical protein
VIRVSRYATVTESLHSPILLGVADQAQDDATVVLVRVRRAVMDTVEGLLKKLPAKAGRFLCD